MSTTSPRATIVTDENLSYIAGQDMNAAQTLFEKTMPALSTIHEHMLMDISQDLSPCMAWHVSEIDRLLRYIMDLCEQADTINTIDSDATFESVVIPQHK